MRFSRTIVTVLGFALAGVTAFTDFGETPADATSSDPLPPAPALPARPATVLGLQAGEAGYGTQLFEFDDGPVRVVAEVPEGEIVDVGPGPGSDTGPGRGVNGLDVDASGRHLLASLDGVAHTPRLVTLTEGAQPEELEHGYVIAVW